MESRSIFCAAICAVAFVWLLPGRADSETPQLADGHPDLNGMWNGNATSPFIKSDDPLASNLRSRDGTLLNFERDGALLRRADPNKPIYKPEFWEKVRRSSIKMETEQTPRMGACPPESRAWVRH